MITVRRLTEYDPGVAAEMRGLLVELSRSGKDKGEIPEAWFSDVIKSPWHDVLVAEEDGKVVGMMTVSVTMGAGTQKNAFVEDFVTTAAARGKGVGSAIWEEMLRWAREKGARNVEFTSGRGREAAQEFYKHKGAEIYETNFFRKEL